MIYVEFDKFIYPRNPGNGFYNSKSIMAFDTEKEAIDFVESRVY